jgi:hypothetical protein
MSGLSLRIKKIVVGGLVVAVVSLPSLIAHAADMSASNAVQSLDVSNSRRACQPALLSLILLAWFSTFRPRRIHLVRLPNRLATAIFAASTSFSRANALVL